MTRKITLSYDSRYINTQLLQLVDDTTGNPINAFVWGVWTPIDFEKSSRDKIVTVSRRLVGRLDLLAFDSYGNPNLWWVIARANDISDPFDIEIGDQLRVPARDIVLSVLNAFTNQKSAKPTTLKQVYFDRTERARRVVS